MEFTSHGHRPLLRLRRTVSGVKQAGFRVLGAIDIDLLSVESYRLNHEEVKVWLTDIRKLAVDEVRRSLGLKKGELDLLAGCPPCQGFSLMRTLNGGRSIHDERNDLVFDFVRFVKGLKPKMVMMENVPGLASNHRMAQVQDELTRLGYAWDIRVLDAADYGVPQRRRRMIFLASRIGEIKWARAARTHRTVRQTIQTLAAPGFSGDVLHDLPALPPSRILDLIKRIPKDGGILLRSGPSETTDLSSKMLWFPRCLWAGMTLRLP